MNNLKTFKSKSLVASKGVFLKLILAVLSKKGNWSRLLKNFNRIALQSRFDLNRSLYLNQSNSWSSTTIIPIYYNRNLLKKSLAYATTIKFLGLVSVLFKVKNSNLLISLANNNKQQDKERFKSNFVFSSLRSIHSLLNFLTVFIELKNKRRGGRVFSVPVPVKSERRRRSIFIHWIKKTINDQRKTKLIKSVSNELNGLLFKRGKSIDQLSSLEKTIRLNRVFLRKSQVKLI